MKNNNFFYFIFSSLNRNAVSQEVNPLGTHFFSGSGFRVMLQHAIEHTIELNSFWFLFSKKKVTSQLLPCSNFIYLEIGKYFMHDYIFYFISLF